MNYLAHAFLSFHHPQILAGNMMSDFVKGAQKFNYPVNIQNGMLLHKAIDQFTDEHKVTKQLKEIFRPTYRLYAGAFIDVCYDHFLAKHFANFSAEALLPFTEKVYKNLTSEINNLHPKFANMLPHMAKHNWLFNYQYTWGIERSFQGLKHRANYITETETAFAIFQQEIDFLENGFHQYFHELFAFSKKTFDNLLQQ